VASRHALEQGVRSAASAVVAHNIPSAILSAAEMESPDIIIMGWRGDAHSPQWRVTNVAQVMKIAKGNVLVLKDRGLENVKRILVPMSGGPHAALGLRLASELAAEWGVAIAAVKVIKGEGASVDSSDYDRQSVALFEDQAESFGFDLLEKTGVSAQVKVITGTDIVKAIVGETEASDLIIMGASNEWSLRQRLFGSIPDQVADQAPVSVLMVRSHQ
jgi:nucleotide-binding universal stress UspA family protein